MFDHVVAKKMVSRLKPKIFLRELHLYCLVLVVLAGKESPGFTIVMDGKGSSGL